MKLVCPNCGKAVEQEILSSKTIKNGIEYLLRCTNCGYTYKKIVEDKKVINLKVIWSDRDISEVKHLSMFEDDVISVGDEINISDVNSLVTAIDSHGKRVRKAKVKDIDTLWAKRFDRVYVKISINRGERTVPVEILAAPDEEFYVGDLLEINGMRAVIHKIKIKDRFVTRGGAEARDIVRIYAKEVREVRRKY